MTCDEARVRLIGGETDAAAEGHSAACAACSSWAEEQRAICYGLGELSRQMGTPPPELEARVLAGFRARRRATTAPWWTWAAAAVVAAGVGIGLWLSRIHPPPPAAEPAAAAHEPHPFVLLDYGRPTQELTAGRLVRVTLPPTAPAWLGLPVYPAAQEGIEAEVFLGDDGVAQAVRLIHPIEYR